MPDNLSERKSFEALTRDFVNDPIVCQMKQFIHHGTTTAYQHCQMVAKKSLSFSRYFKMKVDEEALVRAAFLHDLFLYDWHGDDHPRPHGFLHPEIACQNAMKTFDLSSKEQNIIRSHMWPLTITTLPKSKEAFIVCFIDKWCAFSETIRRWKSN